MSVFEMSEEEKAVIRKQHEEATKRFYQKRADEKSGVSLKPKEKSQEEKKAEPAKKEEKK